MTKHIRGHCEFRRSRNPNSAVFQLEAGVIVRALRGAAVARFHAGGTRNLVPFRSVQCHRTALLFEPDFGHVPPRRLLGAPTNPRRKEDATECAMGGGGCGSSSGGSRSSSSSSSRSRRCPFATPAPPLAPSENPICHRVALVQPPHLNEFSSFRRRRPEAGRGPEAAPCAAARAPAILAPL